MHTRLTQNRPALALLTAAIAATLAIAALGATLIYRANAGEQFRYQAASNCVEIEKLKTAIRGVFDDSLANLERRDIPEIQKQIARAQIRMQLERFKRQECPHP